MAINSYDQDRDNDGQGPPGRGRRRFAYFLIALLAVLLLAFIPPLINVSRLQRRVDTEISAALGRPVHFDRLSLNLLPMPGFTLQNLVIEEDPAFGYEPTLHADEVRINLRLNSLWRRRIEFSSISFAGPSVNLVHTEDGRWNIQGLLQAARIPAAPTAQTHVGPAPRFPYIEATNARVNLKLGPEKLPVALTNADFALWQPAEHQWQLRLEAGPVRTDIAPGETGTLRLQGTLGTAEKLAAMPIDLQATWQNAQLGGATSLLLGRDAGLRGNLSVGVAMLGTVGSNRITATLGVDGARRADFIPPHPVSLSASCRATAESSFHAFSSIECRLPSAASSSPASLALAASVPNVRQPGLSTVRLDVVGLPSHVLFDWLAVATPHPPTAFAGRGDFSGALEWRTHTQPVASAAGKIPAQPDVAPAGPYWTGELKLSGEWLDLSALGPEGAPLGDVILRSTPSVTPDAHSHRASAAGNSSQPASDGFDLLPVSLPLGGARPAILTGHVDDSGYSLELSGSVVLDQLFALGDAIPQFGDGLKPLLTPDGPATASAPGKAADSSSAPADADAVTTPIAIDLTAARAWGQVQSWTRTAAAPAPPHHRTSR